MSEDSLEENNKAVLRRFWEAMNERDLTILDEIMVPDYVDHPLKIPSREAHKQMWRDISKQMPDWHETIEDIAADGDKVWIFFRSTGTDIGGYRGLIPPTGKKITSSGILIYRVVDGKIIEKESAVYDDLGTYEQLGVIKYTEEGKKLRA